MQQYKAPSGPLTDLFHQVEIAENKLRYLTPDRSKRLEADPVVLDQINAARAMLEAVLAAVDRDWYHR